MKKPKLSAREHLLSLPYVHERDDNLYVRITYKYRKTGKYRSIEKRLSADTSIDDAIAIIAEMKRKVGSGPEFIEGARMTFDELLAQYALAHPNLKEWYAKPLEFFSGRKIRSITYGDVASFREAREQVKRLAPDPADKKRKIEVDRKPATINREIEVLRSVLLFGVRHGWLERNPMAAGESLIHRAEEECRDRIPTLEEEDRILAACVPPREHLRGLIIATSDTGLRKSALQALTWAMVDWETRLLRVPKPRSRNKRRPRVIGLTNRLFDELMRMWEAAGKPTEGEIFSHGKDFKRSYATACKIAKVEGVRFNDFRHKFATDLMEANISERLAMKVAGHTSVETHDIYTNVDARLARQVANALDALPSRRPVENGETETQSTSNDAQEREGPDDAETPSSPL